MKTGNVWALTTTQVCSALNKVRAMKLCMVLVWIIVLYTHPISKIVSYHSLSHHSFSDDNRLYKSGNITQLLEIIHSTQSCVSDIKAWMTNNQLQLNNDKTETILIATKTVLNSDCSTVHKSGGF